VVEMTAKLIEDSAANYIINNGGWVISSQKIRCSNNNHYNKIAKYDELASTHIFITLP